MIRLDAHLSPRMAAWIREVLGHDAEALRDIGLRDAEDEDIYLRAKQNNVIRGALTPIASRSPGVIDPGYRMASDGRATACSRSH